MSTGACDEAEHERRARKTAEVDADFEDGRSEYRGDLTYDGDSAEALLDQYERLQDE